MSDSLPAAMNQPIVPLQQLGLFADQLEAVESLLDRAFGLILICGPAGSGRSTVLLSLLQELTHTGVSIVSIERQPGPPLTGVLQLPLDDEAGFDYAAAFRAVIRHGSDVVVFSEPLADVSAALAVRAAETGRKVLAAVEAPTAAAGICRVLALGVTPYLLADTLLGATGQTLAAALCRDCRQPAADGYHAAPGCAACSGSGHTGQLAVFEVMTATAALAADIRATATPAVLVQTAAMDGFCGLREALDRVALAGEISAAEARTRARDCQSMAAPEP